jgi:hypothetical protein
MLQFFMGADLADKRPSVLKKCLVNDPGFGARPLTHAICRSKLIEFGGSWCVLSISSATTRRAIA